MVICSAVSIQYRSMTDGQTDGQNCYINIARELTREKNSRLSNTAVKVRNTHHLNSISKTKQVALLLQTGRAMRVCL